MRSRSCISGDRVEFGAQRLRHTSNALKTMTATQPTTTPDSFVVAPVPTETTTTTSLCMCRESVTSADSTRHAQSLFCTNRRYIITTATSVKQRRRAPSAWEVTPRDLQILEWMARHGIVTSEQVARRFFGGGQRTAYIRVSKLRELGLLRRERWFWNQPQVLRITTQGAPSHCSIRRSCEAHLVTN